MITIVAIIGNGNICLPRPATSWPGVEKTAANRLVGPNHNVVFNYWPTLAKTTGVGFAIFCQPIEANRFGFIGIVGYRNTAAIGVTSYFLIDSSGFDNLLGLSRV